MFRLEVYIIAGYKCIQMYNPLIFPLLFISTEYVYLWFLVYSMLFYLI